MNFAGVVVVFGTRKLMGRSICSWNEYLGLNHPIIGLRGPLTSINLQLRHVKHGFDASNCHQTIDTDVLRYDESILGTRFVIQLVYVTLIPTSRVSEASKRQ